MRAIAVTLLSVAFFFSLTGGLLAKESCLITASNLLNWYKDSQGGAVSFIDGVGARLNMDGIASPFAFSGDFMFNIDFTLFCTTGSTASIVFVLGDSQKWAPDFYVRMLMRDVGEPNLEDLFVQEFGKKAPGFSLKKENAEIPNLNRNGKNTISIVKSGINMSAFLNKALLASFDLSVCSAAKYYLYLSSYLTGGDVVFNGCEVYYEGQMLK